jgi:hypothetical protein
VRLLAQKWAKSVDDISWPELPAEITDRTADSWESPVAIADLAGGDWPKKARDAAVALVAEAKEREPSLGVRLLADLRTVFGERDAMASKAIHAALQALSEAPWNEVPGKQGKGKPLDERGLAFRLRQYGIKPKTVRIGEATPRGYERVGLQEAWARYLPPALPDRSKTSKTSETGPENKEEYVADDVSEAQHDPKHENPTEYGSVAHVADVLDVRGNTGDDLGIPDFLDRRQQPEKTNFSSHSYMSEDDERFVAGSGFK